MPRAARDPEKFHRLHYRNFVTANPEFAQKSEDEQLVIVRNWLFDLWSTDRDRLVMRPTDLSRRVLCAASWKDFWLTDDELQSLVSDVITAFRQQCGELVQ